MLKRMDIKVVFTEKELMREMGRFQFRGTDLPSIWQVYGKMQRAVNIQAFYTPFSETEWIGETGKNGQGRMCAVFVTLGKGVDLLQEKYDREQKVFEEYALECLSMAYLSRAYEKMFGKIRAEEKTEISKFFFWEEKYPLEKLQPLLLKYPQTGITCSNLMVLNPSKTVVIIATLIEESAGNTVRDRSVMCNICQNCTRKECNFRHKNI